MTIYEKLAEARIKLQNSGIKKTGKNDYAKYDYFELSEILPKCNEICEELKVCCIVSFTADTATLEFVNSEKPEEKILFTSPMSEAKLKGCHEVQNLGAVQTYIKRYLYQNCFEIAENDVLDSTMNPNQNNQKSNNQNQNKTPLWSKEQLDELSHMMNRLYPDGSMVFSQKDREAFNKMYQSGVAFNLAKKQATDILTMRLNSKGEVAMPPPKKEETPPQHAADEIPF